MNLSVSTSAFLVVYATRQDSLKMSEPLDTQSSIPPRLGLDENNDPVIEGLTHEDDQALIQMTPLRHVDWRHGPKPCKDARDIRAAYAQRVGIIVPEAEACDKCRSSLGPFASCCVVLIAGQYLFGGSCASCSFLHMGSKCSLRSYPVILITCFSCS